MSYVYETVTQSVIADLEKGVASWVKPWAGGGLAELPYNATTAVCQACCHFDVI
jgi:antirestriction protein ArdC